MMKDYITAKSLVTIILGVLIAGCSSFGSSPDEEKSKAFETSRQYNSSTGKFENRRPGLIDKDRDEAMSLSFIIEWFSGGEDTVPDKKLPEDSVNLAEFLAADNTVKFIWLGHSSLLINVEGKIILVDPVFSAAASPVSFVGKRFQPPVIELDDLPRIDLVLISHDHYDHLDMETIEFLNDKDITFVAPLGVGSHMVGWGVSEDQIVERDWMESFEFGGISFTAAPAQHFSGRGLSDANKTLWASWIIQSSRHNIYFSGDSGYDSHFKTIGETFGPFDIAFIENGQYDDRFTAAHMLPEQAAVAYQELRAKKLFPIHWGMFSLNNHAWYEPPKRLLKAVKNKDDVISPRLGFLYDLSQLPQLERWWESEFSH